MNDVPGKVNSSHGDRSAGHMMNDSREKAVVRVIETMRQGLGEPITIDDMARAAMFSKFHFTRVFQRVTGVSPGRFLSALRLEEAKKLLLSTSLTVTEISFRVGYSSVGTFSSRFKESVGLAPSEYRRLAGYTDAIATDSRRHAAAARSSATLLGTVRPFTIPAPIGLIFVGLFPDWIPQGSPVKCTVLHRPGSYLFDGIPPGTWYLLAHAVSPGQEGVRDCVSEDQTLVVASHGPIPVSSETGLVRADLQLRPMSILDPPVLLALMDIREEALRGKAG
jgi:AraC family transcriptional regulator